MEGYKTKNELRLEESQTKFDVGCLNTSGLPDRRYETCMRCGRHVTIKYGKGQESQSLLPHVHWVGVFTAYNLDTSGVICLRCCGVPEALTDQLVDIMRPATALTLPSNKPVKLNLNFVALCKEYPAIAEVVRTYLKRFGIEPYTRVRFGSLPVPSQRVAEGGIERLGGV